MFSFFSVPQILLGAESVQRVGELARGMGARALLVFNGPEDGPAGSVRGVLDAAGVRVAMLRQNGEPCVEDVDGALQLARGESCDVVLGVGGGSAIDLAKAAAGLLTNGGAALDYMEVVGAGKKITRPAVPWIAVPTTAGTGAEATRNAVIGYPPGQFKASIRSELLLPRVAVIDPQLQRDVPPEVTASSGMDALCQCIEAYTSSGASALTDPLAIRGVELAGAALPRAYADGSDLSARQEMALAALFSGIALTNAGLGAVHGLAAPIGANFPVPHGTVCAALLPHILAANIQAMRASRHAGLLRYARVGRALTQRSDLTDAAAIDACVETTLRLAEQLHIPPLKRFNMGERDIAPMVELAMKTSSMKYNPVALSAASLGDALRKAIA